MPVIVTKQFEAMPGKKVRTYKPGDILPESLAQYALSKGLGVDSQTAQDAPEAISTPKKRK